mgnify:CR=1 FL=1
MMLNENVKIEKDGAILQLVGIENWGAKARFPKYGKMELAMQNTEDLPVKLLLSHDPSHWRGEVLEKYKDIDVAFAVLTGLAGVPATFIGVYLSQQVPQRLALILFSFILIAIATQQARKVQLGSAVH